MTDVCWDLAMLIVLMNVLRSVLSVMGSWFVLSIGCLVAADVLSVYTLRHAVGFVLAAVSSVAVFCG
ncbi:unnamed protein product [Ilex paraguariensis]|uniref:Uncharacterized protein n=1 Tax=Ilex paraguariensis TaxID=185542 RepID=A0ABC8SQ52_9AQUA